MHRVLSEFLNRLTERWLALLAGLVSSRLERLHAASQAEQQSDLEDLARQYEAAGKIEIASYLRECSVGLTHPNLAAQAVEIVRQVATESWLPAEAPVAERSSEIRGLPDFHVMPGTAKPKRRPRCAGKKSTEATTSGEALGDQS